jgi:Zn-finger nucleic acid-binding protein
MICPKCDGVLEPAQVGALLVHVCPKCAGIWLRYGQLKPLLEVWAQGIDFAQARHQQILNKGGLFTLNPDQIMGPCPACPTRTYMLPEVRNLGVPLRIDYCRMGHGLWLDAPEIRQIQSRIRNKGPEYPEAMSQILLSDRKAA